MILIIWNIKTIIRGKYARAPEMEILANLVPSGEYSEEFFKASNSSAQRSSLEIPFIELI